VRILDGGIVTPDSCCLLAALVFSIFPKVARAERLLRDLTEIEEFFGNTFYINCSMFGTNSYKHIVEIYISQSSCTFVYRVCVWAEPRQSKK